VKAFSSGNNEDYILHWAAIFCLFEQKGLKSDVEVRAKLARDQMSVLEDIQKSLGGSAATGKKKTPTDAEKLELEGTEKFKAVLKPFDLVRQLLIGEARTQWDKIVKEMFNRDTWTGGGGGGGVVIAPTVVAKIACPAPAFAVGRSNAALRPPRQGVRRLVESP
jgi:hypothetical protein